jgi:signal peptidase I
MGRLAAVLVLAGGALFFSGCSSLSVRRDLDTIVAMAPAPVLVKKGAELRSAEAAAASVTGAQAFLGAGESMEPIYASGTAIVVTPCDYTNLQPGMSVVYVNHDGRGVAHTLVEKQGNGWIAQGVNNPEQDADLVTARNLVGVITQAYASSDTAMRRDLAARAALKLAASAGVKTQVALNLSKAGSKTMTLAWQ